MLAGLCDFSSPIMCSMLSPVSTMSSTMITWRPSMLLFSPIRFFTHPVEQVPSYEASFTNDSSLLNSIFLIRSLMNMNEPFSTPTNNGVGLSR